MSLCPCGSNNTYPQCCEPAHLNHSSVETPEQLMRSRYSAHVLGLVDYVIATYHPSCKHKEKALQIRSTVTGLV